MAKREVGWLTVYRCTANARHLVYLESALAGYPEEADGPGHVAALWCLWGDGGVLARLPGPFRVVEMEGEDGRRVGAPTGETLSGA